MRRLDVPRHATTLTAMLHAALDAAGIAPAEVARLRLSTTLAANALLAGEAAPVALVATAGFTDTPDLGRQSRRDPDLWPPPPPTPRWMSPEPWRVKLRGRIGADGGEVQALALHDLDALRTLPPRTPVAICLLFAHRNPAHELAAAAHVAALRPDLPISLSHRVDPQPREFERMLATLTDAAVKPLALRLLRAQGLPEPWVMRADGGLAPLEEALARPLGACRRRAGDSARGGGRGRDRPRHRLHHHRGQPAPRWRTACGARRVAGRDVAARRDAGCREPAPRRRDGAAPPGRAAAPRPAACTGRPGLPGRHHAHADRRRAALWPAAWNHGAAAGDGAARNGRP
jgi:N-methylhydantoinase A